MLQNGNIGLACGLFAFIGPDTRRYFSWDRFTILGLFNDSRGGDACGRVYGSIVQHGTGTLEDYKDFNIAIPRPKLKEPPNVILGHCRKASSGGKNEIYAQPIILYRKDVNMKSFKDTHLKKAIRDLPEDTVICSGIHNGTIENYKELAPKYGIPIEDHNDSKVLLTALFYGNFNILSEYMGTAAIIWQNHITGKAFVFRGASKYYSTSTVISEERPLFWCDAGEGNIYLSSIDKSLRSIGASEKAVKEVDMNIIMIFKDGVKIKEVKIDRNTAVQGKFNNSGYSKSTGHSSFIDFEGTGYNESFHRQEQKINAQIALSWNSRAPSIKHKTATASEGGKNPFVRYFELSSEPFRIQAEISNDYNSKVMRKVVYNKSRYWMNGGLMHGIYLLNGAGIIPSRIVADSNMLKPYCFVEGILLDGITSYNKVIGMHDKFMDILNMNIAALCEEEQVFTKQIVKHSRYPVASLTGTIGEQDCFDCMKTDKDESRFYDGMFHPLFSDKEYTFKNGDLIDIKVSKDGIRLAEHDEEDSELSDLYLKECRENPMKDNVYKIGMRLMYIGGTENPLSPIQNMLFGFTSVEESEELRLFWVHYMRDFCNDVKIACSICSCKNATSPILCSSCNDCEKESKKIVGRVNYTTAYGYDD